MKRIELKNFVQNYKKLQLYSTDKNSIENSIIGDLQRDVEEYAGQMLGYVDECYIISKVIAYIEFGLNWNSGKDILEEALKLCNVTKAEINEIADKEAQYMKATKGNLQKLIIWKNTSSGTNYRKKGDIVEEILANVKAKKNGEYVYATDCCRYELTIVDDLVIMRDAVKKISYYLL